MQISTITCVHTWSPSGPHPRHSRWKCLDISSPHSVATSLNDNTTALTKIRYHLKLGHYSHSYSYTIHNTGFPLITKWKKRPWQDTVVLAGAPSGAFSMRPARRILGVVSVATENLEPRHSSARPLHSASVRLRRRRADRLKKSVQLFFQGIRCDSYLFDVLDFF